MERCKFCHPDEKGNYNMVNFSEDESPETWVHLYAYGGEITIAANFPVPGHNGVIMSIPIQFCPFCGERARKEEKTA